MSLPRVLLIATMFHVASQSLGAQEWTRFRGPNGSGVSETEISAPLTSADLAWKAPLPGKGHSSPVAWGNRIFLLSADVTNREQYVLCLDAQSGKELWRQGYPLSIHHIHDKSSFATSTPAVDSERVYVAWADPKEGHLKAFDHNGKELWDCEFGNWIGMHGFGSSPIVHDGRVILSNSQEPKNKQNFPPGPVPSESSMFAVRADTGEFVWKQKLEIDTASYSVPCVRSVSGHDELITCSTAEGFLALEPKTGTPLWKSGRLFTMRTVSSPLLINQLVLGTNGSGGGGNYVVSINPKEPTKTVFEVRKEAPYVPTPVLRDDLLFLWSDNGVITCCHAETGESIWKERVGGKYSGSPIRSGSVIYCCDEEGNLVAIAAEKAFRKRGSYPLGEQSHSTPAVVGDKLLVRTVSHLFAFSQKRTEKK